MLVNGYTDTIHISDPISDSTFLPNGILKSTMVCKNQQRLFLESCKEQILFKGSIWQFANLLTQKIKIPNLVLAVIYTDFIECKVFSD